MIINNDTDVDNDPIFIKNIITTPTKGSAVISPDKKSITYTPSLNQTGEDTLTYIPTDNTNDGEPTLVTITITNQNDSGSISISGTAKQGQNINCK